MAAALLASLLGALGLASIPPAKPQREDGSARNLDRLTFRLDVNFIEVAAVVTDSQGSFVPGLARDDFEILEDGKPQEIAVFTVVDLPRRPRPKSSRGAVLESEVLSNQDASGRLFVLLMDDLRTPREARPLQRLRAREFVDALEEGDLASVIYTSARQRSVGFTTSRETLLDALAPSEGRGPDDLVRELQMADIQSSLGMIEGVAGLLESVTGRRKAVIYFGPGSNYDLTQTFDSRSEERDRSHDIILALMATAGAANRGGVSLYMIDAQGLAALGGVEREPLADSRSVVAASFAERESLNFLADGTGGFAVYNANDLAPAFDRILDDNSRYYLFAYYPTNTARDGKDRTIEVRVHDPSLGVRARKGYRAPRGSRRTRSAIDGPPGVAREVADLLRSPVPIADLPLRATAVSVDGPDHGVAVAMEIDVSALPFEERDGRFRSDLEIGFFLLDGAGSIAEGDGRKVRLDLDSAELADLRRRGLRALSILPAGAGRSQVAVAARETREGRSGLLYWHADVPPKPSSSLAEIVVTSAVESSVPVLSSERDRERLSLFPTTRREFDRSDEIWLQAPPGLGGATARVVGEDGLIATDASFGETSRLRLPLADLGPGAYVLELTSGNPDDDPRTVAFRVR
jgi:Ca-activated chloride channel family protein